MHIPITHWCCIFWLIIIKQEIYQRHSIDEDENIWFVFFLLLLEHLSMLAFLLSFFFVFSFLYFAFPVIQKWISSIRRKSKSFSSAVERLRYSISTGWFRRSVSDLLGERTSQHPGPFPSMRKHRVLDRFDWCIACFSAFILDYQTTRIQWCCDLTNERWTVMG